MTIQRIRRTRSDIGPVSSGRLHEIDDIKDRANKNTSCKGHPYQKSSKRSGSFGMALTIGLLGLLAAFVTYQSRESSSSHPPRVNLNTDYSKLRLLAQQDLTRLPGKRAFPRDERFLLMDYSPWLGFNNMRYMIERGLYLADLLNRTLVLPTHLRIRQCSDEDICAQTAIDLDLLSIGHNPQDSTLALDLGYFIDLDHLSRTTQGRVIAFDLFMERVVGVPRGTSLVDSEFGAQVAFWQAIVERHNRGEPWPLESQAKFRATDEEDEEDEGEDRRPPPSTPKLSKGLILSRDLVRVLRSTWVLEEQENLSMIDNLVRNALVDNLPIVSEPSRETRTFYAFADVRGGGLDKIVEWSVDIEQKDKNSKPAPDLKTCRPPVQDASMAGIPWEARFPAFATCRIENYVGLKQELGVVQDRILSIEGQFHTTGWVPLVYSSLADTERYRDFSIQSIQYSPAVQEAADHMLATLQNMVNERQGIELDIEKDSSVASWLKLSMHVRRGDFVMDKYGWQKFDSQWMGDLVKEAMESVFPGQSSLTLPKGQVPKIGFYMATDETSPAILDSFHALGAIFFEDLIDKSFEDRYRHLIAYDDWIGLVEQLICARAGVFFGTMTSSFTSGIINMRIAMKNQNPDQNYENAYFIKAGGPILTPEQLAQND